MPKTADTAAPQPALRVTAETLATAKEGDSIWVCAPQHPIHDAAGNYLGRGSWEIWLVGEVQPRTIFCGTRTIGFDRKTGEQRGTRGYSALYRVFGQAEAEAKWWEAEHGARVWNALHSQRHTAALRDIAKILDLPCAKQDSTVPGVVLDRRPKETATKEERPC